MKTRQEINAEAVAYVDSLGDLSKLRGLPGGGLTGLQGMGNWEQKMQLQEPEIFRDMCIAGAECAIYNREVKAQGCVIEIRHLRQGACQLGGHFCVNPKHQLPGARQTWPQKVKKGADHGAQTV